jgi:hypothetical protein
VSRVWPLSIELHAVSIRVGSPGNRHRADACHRRVCAGSVEFATTLLSLGYWKQCPVSSVRFDFLWDRNRWRLCDSASKVTAVGRFGTVMSGLNFKQCFDVVVASIHGLNGSLEERFGDLGLRAWKAATMALDALWAVLIPEVSTVSINDSGGTIAAMAGGAETPDTPPENVRYQAQPTNGHWVAPLIPLIPLKKSMPTFKPPTRLVLLLKSGQSDYSGSAGRGRLTRSI